MALRRLLNGLHERICRPGRCSYAQEGEDLVLERLLNSPDAGFYVDVGAHHPKRFSNTFRFYQRGWRGINIEPEPGAIELFEALRPMDVNLCIGIADATGKMTYYRFDEPALNTFDESLKRDREANTPYRVIGKLSVPVERLDAVLARKLPPRQAIDFLSVDVEGLDLRVLRSNDWGVFRPRFVLVEALDFSLEHASGHPVHAFMKGVDYELVAKTLNTIFYRDQR